MSHIVSIRRLSYLQTLLKRPESEITKKIYRAQYKNPLPGDWVKLIQEDMTKYSIHLSEDDICGMDSETYKSYIKRKVRNVAFSELSQMKISHKKVQHINHMGLVGPQNYLTSELLSNKTRSLLYNLRCKSVSGIRGSFRRQYREDIFCPFLCPMKEDTQEHILCCQKLVAHLGNSERKLLEKVKYPDLFGTVSEQKEITGIFLILLRIRKRLLDKDPEPAYEGNNSRPQG